jgi:predicted protein tyrosine phosphatase
MSTDLSTPLLPYRVTICGLSELPYHAVTGVTHVVSILDPAWPDPTDFERYAPHRRIVYRFDDVVEVGLGYSAPTPDNVAAILDLGRELMDEPVDRLLIHCHAGVSRSTAAAAILMAQSNPGREREVFEELERVRPHSWPNALMLRIADALLERNGALLSELRAHQRRVARAFPEFAEMLARCGRADEVAGLNEAL